MIPGAPNTFTLDHRSRLHPYLVACSGDAGAALRLYGWNCEISGAFFESLHYIEVGLRNATRDGRVEVHGRVIAELPLGFWSSLLGNDYNRRLWQPCLRTAFDGPVRRTHLHAELNDLRLLRNRIAHHEPIHGRDLPGI